MGIHVLFIFFSVTSFSPFNDYPKLMSLFLLILFQTLTFQMSEIHIKEAIWWLLTIFKNVFYPPFSLKTWILKGSHSMGVGHQIGHLPLHENI